MPSADEWTRECGTYIREYYSTIKRNTFEAVLMKLKVYYMPDARFY